MIDMTREKQINHIFDILYQYEQIGIQDSNVTLETWRNYLNRLSIRYNGSNNQEVYYYINGLINETNLTHKKVKQIVFHIISIISNESVGE